jgi:voltage-gated potassium channel
VLVLIVTAATLIILTIVVHGVGTTVWLEYLKRHHISSGAKLRSGSSFLILISTALLLVGLHLIEIGLWAITYLVVTPGEFASFEEAAYFSAVTFTTLGYGDITLSSAWRLLSGLEAINGILLVGWTTAFLFAVLQRLWGIHADPPE